VAVDHHNTGHPHNPDVAGLALHVATVVRRNPVGV